MSNFYDDAKFGVITRKWFGLTSKHGGADDVGYTFATTDATAIDHVARHYFRGPIKLVKSGTFVLATIGGGGTVFSRIPVRLEVNGVTESAEFYASDANAPYAISSTVTFTQAEVDAGSYVGWKTGTPESTKGTIGTTATVTGTVAFFIDYKPAWHESKWDT